MKTFIRRSGADWNRLVQQFWMEIDKGTVRSVAEFAYKYRVADTSLYRHVARSARYSLECAKNEKLGPQPKQVPAPKLKVESLAEIRYRDMVIFVPVEEVAKILMEIQKG
jgi:hypothetical protein